MLCLKIATINCPVTDSRSLNQHRPLSGVELDFLLGSHGSLLYWPWCLQRLPIIYLSVIYNLSASVYHLSMYLFIYRPTFTNLSPIILSSVYYVHRLTPSFSYIPTNLTLPIVCLFIACYLSRSTIYPLSIYLSAYLPIYIPIYSMTRERSTSHSFLSLVADRGTGHQPVLRNFRRKLAQ